MKSTIESGRLYWASFNCFELRIPGEAASEIAQPGPADEAVAYWAKRIEQGRDIYGRLRSTPDAIRDELKEYGAWDSDELADDEANWRRIIWIAACNIAEEENLDCGEPLVASGETGPFRNLSI